MRKTLTLLAATLCAAGAVLSTARPAQQTVMLYAPHDKQTGKFDLDRAVFSFERGVRGDADRAVWRNGWDIGYALAVLGDEDYFQVKLNEGDRGVLKDSGALDWFDSVEVPTLEPLPALEKGQSRHIAVDSSTLIKGEARHAIMGSSGNNTDKEWVRTNGIFAKAVVGHMYLAHVKDEGSDFYALFRVEELVQRERCTISWRLTAPPGR